VKSGRKFKAKFLPVNGGQEKNAFGHWGQSTKRSTSVESNPAIPAAATTREADSFLSVNRPRAMTVATKATTPLPTSDQLIGKTGQSIFNTESAPVAFCNRFHAVKPRNVLKEETANRK